LTTGRDACRSCGARALVDVLDLGATPLANGLVAGEAVGRPEDRFPLALAFCESCALVQITQSVPPEKLFSEYPYFSSFSDTMLAHAETIAERLRGERRLGASSLVIEIASNDGYLLQFYRRAGVPVLGVEPAANIARVAESERGIPTLCEFFGAEVGARLAREGRRADVLHANNVLAHVPDLNGFVRGIAAVLKEDGVAVIEAPYVRDMVERLEFDTIYHEHLCYFSLSALDCLFQRHGLRIVHVDRLDIHGGSVRLFAAQASRSRRDASVDAMLAQEDRAGVTTRAYYGDFADRVHGLGRKLTRLLRDIKKSGRRIAAYGASAKGSTLLNTFGIGGDVLDFVADRSAHKQGRYTPGTQLPITAPARLLEAMPDYVLLLTWNFESEILAQQEEYRRRGGAFIIPIPEIRIV
jgi:SAM-dependent methyltransferase